MTGTKKNANFGEKWAEEMRDYRYRKGSNDCLNETARIHNSIQKDGK